MIASVDSLSARDASTKLSRARSFSVDDAFDESGEEPVEFTTEAIRDELARSVQASLGNNENEDPDPGATETTTDGTFALAESVAIINMDESPSADEEPIHDSLIAETASDTQETNETTNVDSLSHHSFPSVIIDLSRAPDSQVIEVREPVTNGNVSSSTLNAPSEQNGDLDSNPEPSQRSPTLPASHSLPATAFTPRSQAHRQTKSSGPSALEKVLSKTRPTFLPPKAKDEDNRHLADWEAMMKRSRAAEEKKRKIREERRLAREHEVEESLPIWEQQILPDWKNAVRDSKFRKMWRQGVPPKLRGTVWERAIGNGMALSKDTYKTCLARAQRAMVSRTFPATILNLIDEDIRSTMPTLHIFTPTTGPLYQDLMDMLVAWVVARSDEGLGYVAGTSKIAAMLLLNMRPASAFVALRNLLEQRHCMRSFYGYGGLPSRDDVEAYYRIFDTLLADYMPKIYFNFKQHQISPSSYLPDWVISLFLDHLSVEACARLWDVILLEGDSFLFRTALAVLAVLEPRLFFPDRKELLDLLSGQNKAAIEVAKREGNLVGSAKYEIFSVNEETVWEEIEAMEDWWKETTWTRLIQRELPDL